MNGLQDPRVTIIVPVYNDLECVLDAIGSALEQVGVSIKLIVVDDGSTQDLEGLLKNSVFWGRFDYVRKSNGGVASARNEGLKLLEGEYCCFLDSDDYLEPSFASQMIEQLRRTGSRLAYSDFVFVDEDDLDFEIELARPKLLGRDLTMETLLRQNVLMTPTVFVRRSVLANAIFPEGLLYNEDWVFWLSLLSNGETFTYLDQPLVRIRTRRSGLSSRTDLHATHFLAATKLITKLYAAKYNRACRNARAVWAESFRSFSWYRESISSFLSAFPSSQFFISLAPYTAKMLSQLIGLKPLLTLLTRRPKSRATFVRSRTQRKGRE